MGWPGGKINVAAVTVKISIFRASIGFKPMASVFLLKLLRLQLQLRWSQLHFICISAVHIIFILFHSRWAIR